MNGRSLCIAGVILSMIITGCKSTKHAVKTDNQLTRPSEIVKYELAGELEPGKPALIEASHAVQPAWTVKPSFVEGTTYYFSGSVKGVHRYSLGVREAKAEAVKNAVEAIGSEITSSFTASVKGDNFKAERLKTYIEDQIRVAVDRLGVSGIRASELYYRVYRQLGGYGVEDYYDVAVLIEMDKASYDLARQRFLRQLQDNADEADLRDALKDMTSGADADQG